MDILNSLNKCANGLAGGLTGCLLPTGLERFSDSGMTAGTVILVSGNCRPLYHASRLRLSYYRWQLASYYPLPYFWRPLSHDCRYLLWHVWI